MRTSSRPTPATSRVAGRPKLNHGRSGRDARSTTTAHRIADDPTRAPRHPWLHRLPPHSQDAAMAAARGNPPRGVPAASWEIRRNSPALGLKASGAATTAARAGGRDLPRGRSGAWRRWCPWRRPGGKRITWWLSLKKSWYEPRARCQQPGQRAGRQLCGQT